MVKISRPFLKDEYWCSFFESGRSLRGFMVRNVYQTAVLQNLGKAPCRWFPNLYCKEARVHPQDAASYVSAAGSDSLGGLFSKAFREASGVTVHCERGCW